MATLLVDAKRGILPRMLATPLYADVLREYFRRESKKTSQRKLAASIGVARTAFGAILSGGKGRDIRPRYLNALAAHRGVPLSTILREIAALTFEMELDAERDGRIQRE